VGSDRNKSVKLLIVGSGRHKSVKLLIVGSGRHKLLIAKLGPPSVLSRTSRSWTACFALADLDRHPGSCYQEHPLVHATQPVSSLRRLPWLYADGQLLGYLKQHCLAFLLLAAVPRGLNKKWGDGSGEARRFWF
jgi:hypothetical protein